MICLVVQWVQLRIDEVGEKKEINDARWASCRGYSSCFILVLFIGLYLRQLYGGALRFIWVLYSTGFYLVYSSFSEQ